MDWEHIGSVAYWTAYTVTFLAVAQWESLRPARPWTLPSSQRWSRHALLLTIGTLVRALVLGIGPVTLAILAQRNSWSLFRQPLFTSGPGYLAATVLTIPIIDLGRYLTHRLLHRFDWLWRIHRVHHSDPDFDVSTGARFHPLESVLVQLGDFALIWLLALPASGVAIEMALTAVVNFLQHANAHLPEPWESRLRSCLLTPDVHRIHHSAEPADFHRNFGETFPWWDRLFGTYAGESAVGPSFAVGQAGYYGPSALSIGRLLLDPLQPVQPALLQAPQKETADAAQQATSAVNPKELVK